MSFVSVSCCGVGMVCKTIRNHRNSIADFLILQVLTGSTAAQKFVVEKKTYTAMTAARNGGDGNLAMPESIRAQWRNPPANMMGGGGAAERRPMPQNVSSSLPTLSLTLAVVGCP